MAHTVTIAGKDYELKFYLSDKREFEQKRQKYLAEALWSGLSDDLNVMLALGLRHASRKITPLAVEDMLQKHLDKGGDLMDVQKAANRAVLESGILGKTDHDEIERLFRKYFDGTEAPKGDGAAG
jgi:hypothetical protein